MGISLKEVDYYNRWWIDEKKWTLISAVSVYSSKIRDEDQRRNSKAQGHWIGIIITTISSKTKLKILSNSNKMRLIKFYKISIENQYLH